MILLPACFGNSPSIDSAGGETLGLWTMCWLPNGRSEGKSTISLEPQRANHNTIPPLQTLRILALQSMGRHLRLSWRRQHTQHCIPMATVGLLREVGLLFVCFCEWLMKSEVKLSSGQTAVERQSIESWSQNVTMIRTQRVWGRDRF